MFKKKSIFFKVFIPVVAVMLLQISIIGITLVANGTIASLEDAATSTLSSNSESRGTTLEQMMVHYWSNLDRLEQGVIEEISSYLDENSLTIGDVLGNYTYEVEILDNMSHMLLDALRAGASTGVYMLFLDRDGYAEKPQTRNGLYYRDLDPLSNPADNSDIMYLRGFVDIARKDRIQLDSLWSEVFSLDPEYEEIWRGFANPQLAAMQYPGTSSINLAYWNEPHFINPWSRLDSNKCITYTRPIIFDGRIIALIGSEVQLTHLEKYYPPNDFESDSQSGYALVVYDSTQGGQRQCRILDISGSYIRRIFGAETEFTLIPTRRDGIYSVEAETISDGIQAAGHPMRLYNSNAPFNSQQWALIAMGTENMLFVTSRSVSLGILLSSLLAFIIGSAILVVTVRRVTRPLISITEQIESSSSAAGGTGAQPFKADSDTYEINLLCSTLNMMSERRDLAESLVREERQRYLVALGSATDTFMEYDAENDIFMLYYFTDSGNDKLSSRTIPDFMRIIDEGKFCHPDDAQILKNFLQNTSIGNVEIRAGVTEFKHIENTVPDGDYYWFMLKASNITDSNGNLLKVIGTAKETTREKLEEFAREEATRRDPVTGFYNRAYGLHMVEESIAAAEAQDIHYLLYVVIIDNFDRLESFYGRVFGAFVLMAFKRAIADFVAGQDIVVRLSNDGFLIYSHDSAIDDAQAGIERIEDIVGSLYTGENQDIKLSPRIRIVRLVSDVHEGENNDKPINISLEVTKENVVSASFDLFERTTDVHSSVNILLGILGNMFDLSRVIVCTFDAGFSTNQVAYQWAREGLKPLQSGIEKIPRADIETFESLLDEDGTLIYTSGFAGKPGDTQPETGKNTGNAGNAGKTGGYVDAGCVYGIDVGGAGCFDDGILRLLCAYSAYGEYGDESRHISAYCCTMREGKGHVGRVIFISDDEGREWTDIDKNDLCDIVKIISANISIDKSRSASRAKSEFLSRVSHEIRTPMNAIIGMTDIAKSALSDPERLQSSLDQIDFSAKHLLKLINDVLDMSRIESGKLKIEHEPFTLDTLVSGIETLMRNPIESKHITFNVKKNYSQNRVVGDEYRLRQVIVNLLANANKFTDESGEISFIIDQVKTGAPPVHTGFDLHYGRYATYRFSVTDNGIGISPEDKAAVFEAFRQASSVSAGQQQGTGLGLAISDSIITAMGGKIDVESMPGKGSDFHFTVSLELQAEDENTDSGITVVDYTGYFKGKRALLVDDVGINIAVASFALSETGIEIDTAYNGQQAVDMFTSSENWYYDIIFMDVKMPVMDGIEATRVIRSNAQRPDARAIPIVAMTANAYDEDMKKTVESGMNGHVTKPIVKEELFALMDRLMEREET